MPRKHCQTAAQQRLNDPAALAKAIAKNGRKVRSDTSRDGDDTLASGPNGSYFVRDTIGVLPNNKK